MDDEVKKTVFLLGDSMLSNVNRYRVSKLTKHKFKVKSRFYPGARSQNMKDHVKPTVRGSEVDQIILHVGTNDLVTENTPIQICNNINFGSFIEVNGIKVAISIIIPISDGLNERAKTEQLRNIFYKSFQLELFDVKFLFPKKTISSADKRERLL